MNLNLYPPAWSILAHEIKAACAWRCTACDRQCRRPGELWLGWDYEAVIAHISQDYDAPAIQVACLCAACHLRYDAPLVWVARRRADRWRQHASGQLELFATRGQLV